MCQRSATFPHQPNGLRPELRRIRGMSLSHGVTSSSGLCSPEKCPPIRVHSTGPPTRPCGQRSSGTSRGTTTGIGATPLSTTCPRTSTREGGGNDPPANARTIHRAPGMCPLHCRRYALHPSTLGGRGGIAPLALAGPRLRPRTSLTSPYNQVDAVQHNGFRGKLKPCPLDREHIRCGKVADRWHIWPGTLGYPSRP